MPDPACFLRSEKNRLAKGSGGDGGIRTLDTLLGYAHLANECLQPLGHVSSDGGNLVQIAPSAAHMAR